MEEFADKTKLIFFAVHIIFGIISLAVCGWGWVVMVLEHRRQYRGVYKMI